MKDDCQIDLLAVDRNGKVVIIEAKTGSGKTEALIGTLIENYPEHAPYRTVYLDPQWQTLHTVIDEPPSLAEFLILLIPPKYRENLLGDLEEDYRRLLPRHGLQRAKIYYWNQTALAILAFLARPLAGIAGVAWLGKLIVVLIRKLLK